MNKCKYCGKEYPDEQEICEIDGERLVEANADCPLCGKSSPIAKAGLLYGHLVCTKCYNSFANRRQLAFVIDKTIWIVVLFAVIVLLPGGETDQYTTSGLALLALVLCYLVLLTKDGYSGYSLGKVLLGLRTINEKSGKPIGLVD